MFGLTTKELKLFKKLNTPIKIQNFLDTVPINYEKHGETYMSPRRVLKKNKMHCMEGALLAAAALWIQGEQPLLLDLKVKPSKTSEDHVVALYKRNGYWGAISKTNHASLRFRDPVYKTIRELALSYFHEYFVDKRGNKILRSYSKPFNLKKFGEGWITADEELTDIVEAIDFSKHTNILPKKNLKYIRKADPMERKAGELLEWKRTDPRTY